MPSDSILPARGCIYAVSSGPLAASGLYQLTPSIQDSAESPVLLQGITTNESDVVLPISALGNARILYTFGQAFGDIAISGIILLGVGNAGGVQAVLSYFDDNRVSNSNKSCTASIARSGAFKYFLTGLRIGEPDSTFNIQPFTLIGVIDPTPK